MAVSNTWYWQVKDAPLDVPLISTGSVMNKEGFLINSGSTILYGAPDSPAVGGKDTQSFHGLSGSRLTLGTWLDAGQSTAVEASAFAFASQSASYRVASNSQGSPGFRIPVYNTVPYRPSGKCDPVTGLCVVPETEDGTPVAIPADLVGSVSSKSTLQLWGADVSGVMTLYRDANWQVSGLAGLRYLALNESFGLTDTLSGLPGSFYVGESGISNDSFKTQNQFFGAGLGLRTRYSYGPWSAELGARVAIGLSHETLDVQGSFVDYGTTSYAATSGPYGTFAMPANEGRFSRDNFAVVPEVQLKLGYAVTPNARLTVGYDALYDSNVIRPGDEISRYVPKGQTFAQDGTVPSTTSPVKLFRTTDFYAHGFSVGVNVAF